MGNNDSAPLLEESETEVNATGEGIEDLPYSIKSDHPLKSLLLAKNKIAKLPTSLKNLELLDLSSNSITDQKISGVSFDYPNLKSLFLSGNFLTTVPAAILTFLNLTDLSIDRNRIEESEVQFDKLANLENLDLFLNMFKEIPKLPPNLVSLNMGFNYIRDIGLSLQNLRELRLPGNCITELYESCNFPNLVILELSMNNIYQLPPIKKIAPKLEQLNLSFNYIEEFPKDFPETIKRIDISHNIINEWKDSMENLVNLKNLDVSHNNITEVPKLPVNLKCFNAEFNKISNVKAFNTKNIQSIQLNNNMFSAIPDLSECEATSLTISHNVITDIDITKICGKFSELNFTSNMIKEIPIDLFLLDRLQSLNLTANGITKLPNDLKNSKITALFINENPISELPELPPGIMVIDAIKCNFTVIPPQLKALNRLSMVNFSNNKIEVVDEFPLSRNISLSCNKIKECPVIPDTIVYLDLAHNQLKNLEIKGDFIILQEFDVSHNQLENIKYDSLPVITTFKMSHNPLTNFVLDLSKVPALRICDISMTKIQKLPDKIPPKVLEFNTSNVEFFKRSKAINVRLIQSTRCGYSETRGIRPTMEDTLIMRENVEPNLNIYAVIDGHGGRDTASLSSYFIPHYFSRESVKSIASFSSVVKKLIERLKRASVSDGATIAFTIVTPNEVSCAYLGDTRALIVSKNKKVSPLSFDHKPTAPAEIALIRENYSFVSDNRTAGILAISRALGDFKINGVVHIPDMTSRVLQEDDYRLVIACDGVFDVLTQEEVGSIVVDEPDVNLAATLVRNIAMSRDSKDNVSVIVVDIAKKW